METSRSDCWYDKVCSIENDNCTKACLRFEEMSFLMNSSGIPKRRQMPIALTPTNDDLDAFRRLRDIKNNIVQFVENGDNLLISSNCTGNGKTTWAIKLMLKYFDSIWAGNGFRVRGIFVHVPTFLLMLKDFNNPVSKEYKENILNADLVIWDDIASSGISQYDYNNLLSFLDRRMLNCKSNIFTTNSDSHLSKIVGERIASRIESSERVYLKGYDRRYRNGNATDTE